MSWYRKAFFVFSDDQLNMTLLDINERMATQVDGSKYTGTNPLEPDTDGDLLQDGFELANGMNPLIPDATEIDYDLDDLDNLKEQILHTDPMNADSDGDGVLDGAEVQAGTDPRNPADGGMTPPESQNAVIEVTSEILNNLNCCITHSLSLRRVKFHKIC